MYAQVEKPKENKNRAVANSFDQNTQSGKDCKGIAYIDGQALLFQPITKPKSHYPSTLLRNQLLAQLIKASTGLYQF